MLDQDRRKVMLEVAPLIGRAAKMLEQGHTEAEILLWKNDVINTYRGIIDVPQPCGTLNGYGIEDDRD